MNKPLKARALAAFRAKDFANAKTLLEEVQQQAPGDIRVHRALAVTNLRLGHLLEAWEQAEQAAGQAEPKDEEIALLQQRILLRVVKNNLKARDLSLTRESLAALFSLAKKGPSEIPPVFRILHAAFKGRPLDRLCSRHPPAVALEAFTRIQGMSPPLARAIGTAGAAAHPDSEEIALALARLDLVEGLDMAANSDKLLNQARKTGDIALLMAVFAVARNSEQPVATTVIADLKSAFQQVEQPGSDPDQVTAALRAACSFKDPARARQLFETLDPASDARSKVLPEFAQAEADLIDVSEGLSQANGRFWGEIAAAADPLAAARAALRKADLAVLVPFGRPRRIGDSREDGDQLLCLRTIEHAASLLQAQGTFPEYHLWPWAPSVHPPRAGSTKVLAYHTFAEEGDSGLIVHKGSYLPGFCTIDRQGFAGWSSHARLTREEILRQAAAKPERDAYLGAIRERYVASGVTKYEQPQALALPDAGYLLLATQVLDDSVQRLARIDQLTLARSVIDWAGRKGRPLVIKRHPRCRDHRMTRLLSEPLPANVQVIEAPIHDLLQGAGAVIVANSGVGFEALLHRLAVITAGGSDYEVATRPVVDQESLVQALEQADAAVDEDFIDSFLQVYLQKILVDTTVPGALESRLEAALRNAGWI